MATGKEVCLEEFRRLDKAKDILVLSVAASVLHGCAVVRPDDPTAGLAPPIGPDSPLVLDYWPIFTVLFCLLGLVAWRSPLQRGLCLGIILGAVAEYVLFRRIEPQYHLILVIGSALLVVAIVVPQRRLNQKTVAVSVAAVQRPADAFDSLVHESPKVPDSGSVSTSKPSSGLAAMMLTISTLLAIDSLVLPAWLT
jgi:hypothetical protein